MRRREMKKEKKNVKEKKGSIEMRPAVAGKTGIKAGVRKGAKWLETVAAPFILEIRRSLLPSVMACIGVAFREELSN